MAVDKLDQGCLDIVLDKNKSKRYHSIETTSHANHSFHGRGTQGEKCGEIEDGQIVVKRHSTDKSGEVTGRVRKEALEGCRYVRLPRYLLFGLIHSLYVIDRSVWNPRPRGDARLSTEICEMIIDCVVDDSDYNTVKVETLMACSLVCRAWRPRSMKGLFSTVNLHGEDRTRSFTNVIQRQDRRFLLRCIKIISMHGRDAHFMGAPTTLLAGYSLPILEYCHLKHLDLRREHDKLYSFSSRSKVLKVLNLTWCQTESLNQLGRFFTSFPLLTTLILAWKPGLRLTPSDSHMQFNRTFCSLKTLFVEVRPDTVSILDYLVGVKPFVTHLKSLTILLRGYNAVNANASSIMSRIKELLYHCNEGLEHLSVYAGSSLVLMSYYAGQSTITNHLLLFVMKLTSLNSQIPVKTYTVFRHRIWRTQKKSQER